MPNHCHNDLYIEGPANEVDALLALIGADQTPPQFDFDVLIPYPAHWAKLDKDMESLGYKGFEDRYGKGAKDGFNSGGYEWCIENWGTKWGAYDVARRDYDGKCITFQTAWSPPRPIIVALAKRFPTCSLHFEFFERGMAICSGFSCLAEADWYDEDESWQAGKLTQVWEGKYRGARGG